MFGISNTRYPIADVKLQTSDGLFYSLARGWNNMWAANGGPFSFPLAIQAGSLSPTAHRGSAHSVHTAQQIVPRCSLQYEE